MSDMPSHALIEPFTKRSTAHHLIHTYRELRQQFHNAQRIQHREWVQPNAESPICDSYEARLMELLGHFDAKGIR
jgi:hypothetical protein